MEEQLTIEQLQAKLQDEINRLAEQRRVEAERYAKELDERNKLAEIERQEKIKEYEEKEKKFREKKAREKEEVEEARKKAIQAEAEAEVAKSAALVAKQELEKQLQWIRDEITRNVLLEEQHKKSLEDMKVTVAPPVPIINPVEINVEHPIAPVNLEKPGDAVEQTDGLEVEPTTMSDHLRHILRQATRPQ